MAAASIEDVTLSVYTQVKKFADTVNLGFAVTTSIESASSMMMDGEDKIILVQNSLKDRTFLELEYKVFVSFAKTSEVNGLLTTEIMSKFLGVFKRYSKICISEATGLKQIPSVYNDTGKALVIKDIGQSIVSITQMRNNLNCIELKLTGYIK